MATVLKKSKGVILWDIDGTLISPIRNNFESPHFNAIKKNGFTPKEKYPTLLGSTDFEVMSNLLKFYPSNNKKRFLKKCFEDLDDVSLSLYHEDSFSLCLGVPEVLIRINELGWDNGILTGNTYKRMLRKLEILKILNLFNQKLIFSCNFNDTREKITERAKKTLKFTGYSNSFIVGDTPRDIYVAKKYNFKVVSVGTGNFSIQQLESFNPNLIIRNLKDDLEIFLHFTKVL